MENDVLYTHTQWESVRVVSVARTNFSLTFSTHWSQFGVCIVSTKKSLSCCSCRVCLRVFCVAKMASISIGRIVFQIKSHSQHTQWKGINRSIIYMFAVGSRDRRFSVYFSVWKSLVYKLRADFDNDHQLNWMRQRRPSTEWWNWFWTLSNLCQLIRIQYSTYTHLRINEWMNKQTD